MRRKKSRVCGFHFYGWCDWAKVRCHYQDEIPPRPSDPEPCAWAARFAEKNFCPTPKDAEKLRDKFRAGLSWRSLQNVLHRVCSYCEKPVRPLRDAKGYEKYQEIGMCQDCQDRIGDDDELTEEDFE